MKKWCCPSFRHWPAFSLRIHPRLQLGACLGCPAQGKQDVPSLPPSYCDESTHWQFLPDADAPSSFPLPCTQTPIWPIAAGGRCKPCRTASPFQHSTTPTLASWRPGVLPSLPLFLFINPATKLPRPTQRPRDASQRIQELNRTSPLGLCVRRTFQRELLKTSLRHRSPAASLPARALSLPFAHLPRTNSRNRH